AAGSADQSRRANALADSRGQGTSEASAGRSGIHLRAGAIARASRAVRVSPRVGHVFRRFLGKGRGGAPGRRCRRSLRRRTGATGRRDPAGAQERTLTMSGLRILVAEIAAKGTAVLALALVLNLCLRRAAAATRHLVWTGALLGVLALPALTLLEPRWCVLVITPPTTTAAAPPVEV